MSRNGQLTNKKNEKPSLAAATNRPTGADPVLITGVVGRSVPPAVAGGAREHGDPKYPATGQWSTISEGRLKQTPVKLDVVRRSIVERAIRNACEKRGWSLYAVSIRTNHGHIVVANAGKKPEQMLNAFKANATREMREAGCWTSDRSPWADKGSQRWLWTDKHVSDAVEYVVNGQGYDLPKFD